MSNRRLLAPYLLACALSASSLGAQTLIGRVVSAADARPLGRARVALWRDSAVVANATADTAGVFYLDAPQAGTFAVVITPEGTGPSLDANAVTLAEHDELQREFRVAVRRIYADSEVSRTAQLDRTKRARPSGRVAPPSPRTPGSALVEFVVDTNGRVDPESFHVLKTDNAEVAASVRATILGSVYHPAEIGEQKVPQLVQTTIEFKVVRMSVERGMPPGSSIGRMPAHP